MIRAASIAAAPAITPAGGIPLAGRQAAQRLARAELAKPVYHQRPPLTARILNGVAGWLGRLFRTAERFPGGWWALVVLTALAVVVVAVVLARVGPVARSRRAARELTAPGQARTARDHRAAAARLADTGDFAGAICEGVRAIAAELDERGLLRPRTGRTADEFAAEAGQALPRYAAGLRGAAVLFDEVRYGQRPGSRAGYARVAALDAQIVAEAGRPGRAAVPAMADGAAMADGTAP